jgi:hypothetical protein
VFRSAARKRRLWLLAAVAIALFVGVRLPRADDPRYIDFAGPRALNVWSNAAFLLAGAAGLISLVRARKRLVDPAAETWPLAIFFLGNVATCFGSAYFHAQPNLGWRLAWDRLPMTIAFAAFLGMHINERIEMGRGTRLMIPLAIIGAATVKAEFLSLSRALARDHRNHRPSGADMRGASDDPAPTRGINCSSAT